METKLKSQSIATQIRDWLKSYYDTLYAAITHDHTSITGNAATATKATGLRIDGVDVGFWKAETGYFHLGAWNEGYTTAGNVLVATANLAYRAWNADALTTPLSTMAGQWTTAAWDTPAPTAVIDPFIVYYFVHGKVVHYHFNIRVASVGNCAGRELWVSLPHTSNTGGGGFGREKDAWGGLIIGNIATNANYIRLVTYAGAGPIVLNYNYLISGTYGIA